MIQTDHKKHRGMKKKTVEREINSHTKCCWLPCNGSQSPENRPGELVIRRRIETIQMIIQSKLIEYLEDSCCPEDI